MALVVEVDTEEEAEGVLDDIEEEALLVGLEDTEEVAVEVQVEDTEADHRDDLLVGGIVVALLVDQDIEADRAEALDHIEVIEMIVEMLHDDHMMHNKKEAYASFLCKYFSEFRVKRIYRKLSSSL